MAAPRETGPSLGNRRTETPTGKKVCTRRPHRKTKTGCKQCRVSRVKCDGTKPSCSYCVRHSKACSFLCTGSNEDWARELKPTEESRGTASESGSSHSQALPFMYMRPNPSPPSLQMNDLELLHHYTASTYLSVAHGPPEHENVWQIVIPTLAIKHPFLMHGILAVAALHLAHLFPDRRNHYAVLAEHHESLALPLFLSEAINITQENCAAVFAFSKLVVVYAMSAPDTVSSFVFPEPGDSGGIPPWFPLLRGAFSVLSSAKNWVAASPVGPLLYHDMCSSVKPNDSDDLHLVALFRLFYVSPSTPSERKQELSIYRDALAGLRKNFAEIAEATTSPSLWPAGVSEEYLRFLGERRYEALVLLAYQCVLLKRTEPCWYLDGLAQRLMVLIHETLPDDFKCWIQWPLQQIELDATILVQALQ